MDIFEFAMKMEKDGEALYREIAENAGDKGVTAIMNLLADEEARHFEIFKRMKSGKTDLQPTKILDNVKNIFVEMRESGKTPSPDSSQLSLYQKALELEESSRVFYLEKSEEVEKADQKEILLEIAEEEKRHYLLLENIIDFISRPIQWLENAEFNKLEKY